MKLVGVVDMFDDHESGEPDNIIYEYLVHVNYYYKAAMQVRLWH